MTTTRTLNNVDIETVAALTAACADDPEKAATTWKAAVDWNGGFRSEARVREFDPLPSDEPAGLGGTDQAPNPVEQLLAALGNCLAVGVAANATGRGISVDRLSIEVEGDLDLSAFLGLKEGHAGFESIRARIDIEADTDPRAIEDLVRAVVATSPVGHTLTRQIPVEVTTV
ncbi:MAG: OsmC family protein [Actinomycetota bacterium]